MTRPVPLNRRAADEISVKEIRATSRNIVATTFRCSLDRVVTIQRPLVFKEEHEIYFHLPLPRSLAERSAADAALQEYFHPWAPHVSNARVLCLITYLYC